MGLRLILLFIGALGVAKAQLNNPSFGSSSPLDLYNALVQVKINCRNVPGRGLVCSADYPDHCKEQWNFQNPCTQNNIDMNITKFAHPFDKSKFLMCGQMGKLYVVQCPQYEVFHEGCSQCIGAEAGLTASCEVPLPPTIRNVCTREAILNNKLFFPFPGNLSRFIHCDIWGKPWERICTPGEVWSKWDVTCVLPHLLNPCNRPTTDLTYLYSHPCDPSIYLTCDLQGRAHEVNCLRGEAFHEESQRCRPYADFTGQVLSSFCENYMFGFRQNHGNEGFAIDNSETTNMGFQTDNRGFTIDRTSRGIGGSISVMPNPTGQGSTTTFDLRGGQLNRETNLIGQGDGTASFDKSTQLRGGSLGGQLNTDGQGNFGGSLDIKRGSVSGDRSGSIGQGSLGQSSGTNFIDIRGKSLSTDPSTAEFVDIRNAGTSGTSANMIDIRGVKGIGSRDLVDIRGGSIDGGLQTDASGKMIDIRDQATGEISKVDIRGVGTDMSGGMVDIRNMGSGSRGNGMVDIRGNTVSGTKNLVDIRGVGSSIGGDMSGSFPTDLSGGMFDGSATGSSGINMIDIRGVGTSSTGDISGSSGTGLPGDMVDIRNQGSSGTGMVDIRGGSASGTNTMLDIRGGGTGGMVGDISRTGTDVSGGMIDIRGTGTGSGGIGMVDIRGGSASGANNLVDIRGVGTGSIGDMGGSSGTSLSGGMVDIRDLGSGTNNMIDIRGVGTGSMVGNMGSTGTGSTGGLVDIRDGTSSSSGGMVDIRGGTASQTKKMFDIRGAGTGNIGEIGGSSGTDLSGGMVDIRGGTASQTNKMLDIRGAGTGNIGEIGGSSGTDLSGGMVDIRNQGSSGAGMVDIRGGSLSGKNTKVDIRGVGTSGIGDISGSLGTDLSGGTGTGSSGSNMLDIRGGRASKTNNMIDIRGFETGRQFVDIRGSGTGVNGRMMDIRGTGTGSGDAGMVDIRGGQASGMKNTVDIRGIGTGGMSSTATDLSGRMVDIRGRQRAGDMVDIRGNPIGTNGLGSGSGQGVLDGGLVDFGSQNTRTRKTDMVDIRRSQGGTNNGRMTDIRGTNSRLGGMSSFDIRNQLGLNGQLGTNTIDRSGTVRTDTITIEGSIQGGRQGTGTMQDLLNTWNQIIETGSSSSTGRQQELNRQTGSNQGGNRRILNDIFTVHPSRLKMYDYSDIPFSEPCTQINLDEGRTHFRYRGHPHMFLQCDTSGRMHRMPCSSTGQDYFDPYTNTCVDGPVHVDNRIQ
ncbi:uncharacterized PE-PGRS family protein PE_PGRS54-like isoform X2 [Ruditapes philippinarum]|uniref:uncharacterized PE-PGRS family protein PE_PGRS54-like isoform X2 n=1 Tax=Ruditapes philippinarum TaxID=129788 RepID=UPI00295AF056|nr:uncharacterized PE-PGRS family protein PE_PGRS54-like isoform X2 [Ruditapes philippinarum]